MNPTPPLERFVRAQLPKYAKAIAELRVGRKQSHWIWYVLPQLKGLGRSEMAVEYGLSDRAEALDYIKHSVLGPRLIETVEIVLQHKGRAAVEIFGETDAMKFRSCITLFAAVAPDTLCFSAAIAAFFDGVPDKNTLQLLRTKDASEASPTQRRT